MYTAPKIVGPRDGKAGNLGSIGVRFLIDTEETHDGNFSLVEHPLPPRRLAAPLHLHTREDEYSFVLEGVVGVQIGDAVYEARPGDMICKPRDVPHAFWNPADEPARLLEIISPGGFADFFRGVGELAAAGPPDPAEGIALADRFHLSIDASSVPGLVERHGLRPR